MKTRTVALSDAKTNLSQLVEELGPENENVVIKKRKKEVAVLVDIRSFRRLQELEDRFLSLQLKKALKGKMHDLREVLGELKLDV